MTGTFRGPAKHRGGAYVRRFTNIRCPSPHDSVVAVMVTVMPNAVLHLLESSAAGVAGEKLCNQQIAQSARVAHTFFVERDGAHALIMGAP